MPVPTHCGKDLSIDWKGDSYDSIFVIINRLTKIVYYELVKVTINFLSLAKVIINVVVKYHGLPDLIVTDRGFLFISKFWSLLYYFTSIKQKLSTAFHLQTDKQTKKQNSIMKVYLRAFINFEQNDWAQLFPMAEFIYNNVMNASTGYTSFELKYGYYSHVYYKEEEILDPCSKSKTVKELSSKFQKLIIICQQNLHHTQKLEKRAHNKGVKPQSYTSDDKVWLTSKHLKTKRNCKLEAKFLGLFWVL